MGGRLAGKVAFITGAGTGIGAATAARFAQEGAQVMICGRRAEPLQAVVAAISAEGGKASWVQADVTDEASLASALERTAHSFGRLDIMVNNAVNYTWGLLEQITMEQWHQCLRGSLDVAFIGTRLALPLLRKSGAGAIVNMGSVCGLLGSPGLAAYSAAKAGVINFSRTAALECATANIRVNVVIPGVVWSEGTDAALDTPEKAEGTARVIPLKRIGQAVEVANAILFLASDEASYITGQTLVVDGGKTCELNVGKSDYVSAPSN